MTERIDLLILQHKTLSLSIAGVSLVLFICGWSLMEMDILQKWKNIIRITIPLLVTTGLWVIVNHLEPSEHPFFDWLVIFSIVVGIAAWVEVYQQTHKVNGILRSLPTRFIRSFPKHLEDIISLLNHPVSPSNVKRSNISRLRRLRSVFKSCTAQKDSRNIRENNGTEKTSENQHSHLRSSSGYFAQQRVLVEVGSVRI